jgi:ABC-type amino acid transport substrate-binding protein
MTRRTRLILTILGLLVAHLMVTGPEAGAAEPAVLKVGIDTRTPPWCYIPGLDYSKEDPAKDPTVSDTQVSKMIGLDVDVARALGKRLGTSISFVPTSWYGSEAGLLAKHFDLIVNGWTPGRKTPETIFASEPYCDWGLLIVVRADNKKIASYSDLAGTTVGHYQDTVAERTVRSLGAGQLVPYESQERLFDDVKSGVLTAALFDSLYVRWRCANDPTFRAVGDPLNRLGYHVGVRKEDSALCRRVTEAVSGLVTSGEMAEIRRKWEGGH